MEEKDTMFEDGADTVLGRLDSAAASTGTALAESLGHLAQQVSVLFQDGCKYSFFTAG